MSFKCKKEVLSGRMLVGKVVGITLPVLMLHLDIILSKYVILILLTVEFLFIHAFNEIKKKLLLTNRPPKNKKSAL